MVVVLLPLKPDFSSEGYAIQRINFDKKVKIRVAHVESNADFLR